MIDRKRFDVQEKINSADLAERQRAIKDLSAVKSKYESFNQIKSVPVNKISIINIKLLFDLKTFYMVVMFVQKQFFA